MWERKEKGQTWAHLHTPVVSVKKIQFAFSKDFEDLKCIQLGGKKS